MRPLKSVDHLQSVNFDYKQKCQNANDQLRSKDVLHKSAKLSSSLIGPIEWVKRSFRTDRQAG